MITKDEQEAKLKATIKDLEMKLEQKTQAHTEVKESLSLQLSERDVECEQMKRQIKDFEAWKKNAQEEELQRVESKMVMQQVC